MLDEPVLGPGFDAPFLVPAEEPAVLESIQALVHHEPFAVLCTQAGGQPYGSLVGFAFSVDLKHFVFATPMATRKYRLALRMRSRGPAGGQSRPLPRRHDEGQRGHGDRTGQPGATRRRF